MTYQLSRGTASYYLHHPEFPEAPWLVEKILRPGEAYLIGTFMDRKDAEVCWNSLRASMEVSRGALVTEAL